MWTKSSYCRTDTPMCVEVAGLDGAGIHVRDSKHNGMSWQKQLNFTREEWQAFIDGVRNGDFDLKEDNSASAEEQMEQV